jgi:AcrR family transcriptional regulator
MFGRRCQGNSEQYRSQIMGRREEKKEETRRRIVEAAEELHATVGFANATISAVALRAGVERLTVYRYFPTEKELVAACAVHFFSLHPLPDPRRWAPVRSPRRRLRAALTELYAYYGRTEANMANFVRDVSLVPFLPEIGAPMWRAFGEYRETLARGWHVRGRRRAELLAAVGHALDFGTWRSLVRQQGLEDAQAVELMVRLVRSI